MFIYYHKKFYLMVSIGLSCLFAAACSKYISKSAVVPFADHSLDKNAKALRFKFEKYKHPIRVFLEGDNKHRSYYMVPYLENELERIIELYNTNSGDSCVTELRQLLEYMQALLERCDLKGLKSLADNIYKKSASKNETEKTPFLIQAILDGRLDIVEILFEILDYAIPSEYSEIFSAKFGYGRYTIIHQAIASGKLDILKYLIEKLEENCKKLNDIDQKKLQKILYAEDFYKQTPLHLALQLATCIQNEDSLAIVKYLLDYINIFLIDNKKVINRLKDISSFSVNMFKDVIDAILDQKEADEEKIKKILNISDERGNTFLHDAVERAGLQNSQEEVKFLMSHGADWTKFNNKGVSPIILAIIRGDLNTVKSIVQCANQKSIKSLINKKNKDGNTALHYAAGYKKFKLPLNLKQNTNIVEDQDKIINCLLDAGADHSIKNEWGDTPLYQAVQSERYNIAAQLIQKGSNPLEKNKQGNTPLEQIILKIPMHDSKLHYNVSPIGSKRDTLLNLLAEFIYVTQTPVSGKYQFRDDKLFILKEVNFICKESAPGKHVFIQNVNEILKDHGIQLSLPLPKFRKRKDDEGRRSLVPYKKRKTNRCDDSSGKNQGT